MSVVRNTLQVALKGAEIFKDKKLLIPSIKILFLNLDNDLHVTKTFVIEKT